VEHLSLHIFAKRNSKFFCKKHRCVKKGSKSREPAKEAGYIIAEIS